MRYRLLLPLPLLSMAFVLLGTPPAAAQDGEAIARGAQVWSQHCVRCHTPRAAGEYTDRQWATIVLHMRARGNLTREEARVVTAFLQATNQPAGVPSHQAASTAAEEDDPSPAPSPEADEPSTEEPGNVWTALLRYLAELRSP
jgi:mono/diheme cytochrome c family protein